MCAPVATRSWRKLGLAIACLAGSSAAISLAAPVDVSKWQPTPEHFAGMQVDGARITAQAGKWKAPETSTGRWAYLASPDEQDNFVLTANVTIEQAATSFGFFGKSWSVWPDHTYGDQGFEAGVLLRAGERQAHPKLSGYRVQLSHKYQCVALVKYPDGGYLRVAPCEVKLNTPQQIEVAAIGSFLRVRVDGAEKIAFNDGILPIARGHLGLGTSSGAKVTFANIDVGPPKFAVGALATLAPHKPRFSVRQWLGDRAWVFDGDEPILLLPVPEASYINNVKLRPGYKPQLSWNSHWDVQNQGAYAEADNKISAVTTSGGGDSLTAKWSARHVKDRFLVDSTLTFGFDLQRNAYTYDVDSKLTVQPGPPFEFRYGYDFEHHTPLDPFNWQYLVVRREGGVENLSRRPVYPVDPGQMSDLEGYHGLRMWYGRHNEALLIAPAVEYQIDPDLNRDPDQPDKPKSRKLGTAVCAAFYDTGISYGREIAKAGTVVHVKYRYTGYPAEEAESRFAASENYASPMLDPQHEYIFAEWPTLTFSQHLPMNQTWQYGRVPFMTSHNSRPTYELAGNTGIGSGFAMKLPPKSYGAAQLPLRDQPLTKGRYAVSFECRSDNAYGPGGRVELSVTRPKTNEPLSTLQHFIGNGTFDWKHAGFAFDVPEDGCGLKVGFGNNGTGDAWFAMVNFRRLEDGAALPGGVAAAPQSTPPAVSPAPAGAVAEYRLAEGRGHHALDFADGPFGLLELANLEWTVDEGRPALRFADNSSGRPDYLRYGKLDRTHFSYPGYQQRQTVAVALAGTHGGPNRDWNALTVAAFVKPAAEMGPSEQRGYGDIVGLGARRFILGLKGQKAPYQLNARLNVNDIIVADKSRLDADRWYHVAMTCEPNAEHKWHVRLYVDGLLAGEGDSRKLEAPTSMANSLVLGTELYYFHTAYYRGLIGPVTLYDRALSSAELQAAAKR